MAPAWPCTGYLPSPKLSSVLLVPRQPNLWFRPASATSLRTPVSCPSVSTSFLGTMNSDRPLVPASSWPSAPGILASTRWMMFSVSSCSPAEIHILWPWMRSRGPSGSLAKSAPSGTARVVTSLSEEPACGSDKHMVPEKRPENPLCANTVCCRRVPCTISRLALPTVSRPEPMLTEAMAKKLFAAATSVQGSEHARCGIGAVRIVRALGQYHALAVEVRLLAIDGAVEGRVFLAGHALATVEHGIEGLARVLGKAAALGQRWHLQPLVQQEIDGRAQAHGIYSTSKTPAAPMPPPMHMVTHTRRAPRRLPSISAWPVRRWPDTP